MTDAGMLTLADYTAHVGKSERTVRRWLATGQLPGAELIGREWWIPEDARPTQPDTGRVTDMAGVMRDREVAVAAPAGPRFWFTVDDLVDLWAPVVSHHAVLGMIRDGDLPGAIRRGPAGSWIVPAADVRRIGGW